MVIKMDVKVYGKKSWSQSFRDRYLHKRKKPIQQAFSDALNKQAYTQSEKLRPGQMHWNGLPL